MAGYERRFTVEEFHRIEEAGVFRADERVELVGGIIRVLPLSIQSKKSRWNWAHQAASKSIYDRLREALRDKASVYSEAPVASERGLVQSEPKPDVLVCSKPDEGADGPPRTKPLLVVEVADRSLEYDLGEKAAVYAEAGVPEYWVLNLAARILVIHRKPLNSAYFDCFGLNETLRVSPEAWPEITFEVFDFLPPLKDEDFPDHD